MTATTTPAVDRRVAEAECYVRTRFYPPLPYQYGAYAVAAVDACNDGDEAHEILLDPELPIHPQAAHRDESGSVSVTAAELVDALKLWHMVEEEDDDPACHGNCDDFLVEMATSPSRSGAFETWEECELCGSQRNRRPDSLL